jgi:hypothetical protein
MSANKSEASSRLLYYYARALTGENEVQPDLLLFKKMFRAMNRMVAFVDRSNTVRLPIRTRCLFPIPSYAAISDTFEDICNERAVTLLRHAEALGIDIYVFWSGGIDSTLVLISLLKNASEVQKRSIVVLCSEDSITENPNFYRDHLCGKLRMDSAIMFPYLLGSKHLIVNGEHNDQLFGSDMVGKLIVRHGNGVIHQRYNRPLFREFFDERVNDLATTDFYLDLFEQLTEAAPIPITTNFTFLWWLNFCLKWQDVFMRSLTYTAPRQVPRLDAHYVENNYAPFFCTEKFQLWSLSNPDKRIRDSWKTYKWICKDIIYDYTKDADYRDNKVKKASLCFLFLQNGSYNFIDDAMKFDRQIELSQFYDPKNDFVVSH